MAELKFSISRHDSRSQPVTTAATECTVILFAELSDSGFRLFRFFKRTGVQVLKGEILRVQKC